MRIIRREGMIAGFPDNFQRCRKILEPAETVAWILLVEMLPEKINEDLLLLEIRRAHIRFPLRAFSYRLIHGPRMPHHFAVTRARKNSYFGVMGNHNIFHAFHRNSPLCKSPKAR